MRIAIPAMRCMGSLRTARSVTRGQNRTRSLLLITVTMDCRDPVAKAAMLLLPLAMMGIRCMRITREIYPARFATRCPIRAVMAAMSQSVNKPATRYFRPKDLTWGSISGRTRTEVMPGLMNMYRFGMCRFRPLVLIFMKRVWCRISQVKRPGYMPLLIISRRTHPKQSPARPATEIPRSS